MQMKQTLPLPPQYQTIQTQGIPVAEREVNSTLLQPNLPQQSFKAEHQQHYNPMLSGNPNFPHWVNGSSNASNGWSQQM